jgi:hypothetical protein
MNMAAKPVFDLSEAKACPVFDLSEAKACAD